MGSSKIVYSIIHGIVAFRSILFFLNMLTIAFEYDAVCEFDRYDPSQ